MVRPNRTTAAVQHSDHDGDLRYETISIFMFLYIIMLTYFACITFSEAMSGNPHFEKPLRSDFQASMPRALRTAKERVRSRKRGTRSTAAPNNELQRRRDFWSDQQPEEEAGDL